MITFTRTTVDKVFLPEYALLTMPVSELAAIRIAVRVPVAPVKVILDGRVLLLFLLGPSVACALPWGSLNPRGSWGHDREIRTSPVFGLTCFNFTV